MKSGIPWNLRGVDEETREAIYAAARRAGLSVSEWLNSTVYDDDDRRPAATDDDTASVTAALDRLTRRLRTMDESARAGVPGLMRRLDEIEHELDRLPERGAGSAAKPVWAMIDRLSRDIDDADERARRMIEGQRASRAAASDLGRISDAIRDLDRRIARMSEQRPAPAREERSVPRQAPPQSLDDIRRRLDGLLAERPRAPASRPSGERAASIDAALRGLESRIDEAKARIVTPRPAAAGPDGDAIARLERRLNDISSRLGGRGGGGGSGGGDDGGRGPTGDLASAVAEITAHQRNLDDRAEAFAARRDQSALSVAMAALRNDVATLTEQVGTIGRTGAMDQSAAFDLARRIDALAAERPLDHALLNSIRTDLEGLRDRVEDRASAASLHEISDRLDALARATPDRGRLDALGQEVLALRRVLESDDSPRAIQRLEMHLAELSRNVEGALAARNPTPEVDRAVGRLEQRLDDFAAEIAARLAERSTSAPFAEIERLEERLDGLSRNIVSTLAERETVAPDIVHRFEERLDDIAARVDSLLDRAPASTASIETMQTRLENLIAAVEGISAAQPEPSALDDLKAEIAAIRHDIAGRSAPDTGELERQVQELAARLETATRPGAENAGLAELEAQVAHLAAQLEHADPGNATLRQVEQSLDALQGHLARNHHRSIEAARAEARAAVREFAESTTPAGIDSDLIRALRHDLDTLRAAVASGAAASDTAQPMAATLSDVAEHLGELERATGTHGMPRGGQPSAGDADAATSGRRADFIAAARRAAQAAAETARHEAPRVEAPTATHADAGPEPRKAGAFSRISQAIRNRNRPLLLAAAAIVLAIGAMKLYGNFASDREANDLIAAAPAAPVIAAPAQPAMPSVRDLITTAGAASAEPGRSAPALVAPAAPDDKTTFAAPEVVANGFIPSPAARSPAGLAADNAAPLPAAAAAGPTPDAGIGNAQLMSAVAAGDPTAAFEVAARYAAGDRVKKDLTKAAQWYERAADAGIAVAQYRLGSLYERGQGVGKDLNKAADWYQRSADQGNVNAMHNLAVLMSEGVDGPPDAEKALRWFLAAADYGLPDSQYNLGVIYARGLGATQDLVTSYKWFAIAAAQGDPDAKARRDEVAKVLSADDLAKGRAEAKAWRAKPPLAEANGVSAPEGGWDGAATTLAEADRDGLVKKIQTLLAEQGFDPGPADGVIGSKTREAVRAYQRQNGIAETGQIDRTLVTALAQAQH